LVAGLLALPRAEVEVLPDPRAVPLALILLERPGVVERRPGDRTQMALRGVVAGEDDGVQDRLGGVRFNRLAGAALLVGVERNHLRPVADALLYTVHHYFVGGGHRCFAERMLEDRASHRVGQLRVARYADRALVLLGARPVLPPDFPIVEIFCGGLLAPRGV